MGSFDYTITTRATPEQAHAYLADLRNLSQWVRQVDDVTEQPDGHYAASFSRLLLSDLVVDYVVDTPPGSVVATGTSHVIDVVDRWDVSAAPEGAEVAYAGTYELKGPTKLTAPFAQLFGSSYESQMAKALTEHLDALAAG